jgi:predicted DNA-binding protein (MmcQ/YjbR family)
LAEKRPEPPEDHVLRVARVSRSLPDAYEEEAWTGTRWRIRGQTFAHVMVPRAEHLEQMGGPREFRSTVRFRSAGEEFETLRHLGAPYLVHPVQRNLLVLLLDDDTDWDEVAELVVESYRLMAPQKLVRMLDGATPGRGPRHR